jgi:GNAT superfamily N-acetyltransferase
MFASVTLAARIDRAEARLSASLGEAVIATQPDAGAFVEEIDGGVAVYTGPASPMNKMIGVGFDGVPAGERLESVERNFKARGAPLQAEVATLANPAVSAELTRRGYVLRNFENVLGLAIARGHGDVPPDSGITIELMRNGGEAEWLDAGVTGFLHPDVKGVQAEPLPPRAALESALGPFMIATGFRRYVARIDGRLAGVATARLDADVAQLCGAATLPAFRRRGVQAALLRWRLADAFQHGCDLAVMTTQPGSTSQENGHRQGFALLYSRAILIKPAD